LSDSFQAAGWSLKHLRKDLEGINAKIVEINNELRTISTRVTEIKTQLTKIEEKLPEKPKAKA